MRLEHGSRLRAAPLSNDVVEGSALYVRPKLLERAAALEDEPCEATWELSPERGSAAHQPGLDVHVGERG